ncbi:hypothetical protein F5Y14DRAFT_172799 [Nemania sp. NC0429]|nr:hypothetical protein F5Y14DRAFT_172799 [Nemania sp. NC0429]
MAGTETQDEPSRNRIRIVASTGDVAAAGHPIPTTSSSDAGYFESAQWTADGTALLTYSSTNVISGYIVPEDLLSSAAELALKPQARIRLPEPSNVLSGAPYFSLAEPQTQQLLVSARDHPLQLFYLVPSPSSASASSHSPISSYPFTKARSETFLSATSLLWPAPGTHFIAGSRSILGRFDVTRTGEEPVARIRTIPSERHLSKGGGVGMRGTVSALGGQPMDNGSGASLVAAGTWTRWVGLYDFAQAGECVATWSIAAAVRETAAAAGEVMTEMGSGGFPRGIGGDGITQTIWSPCGRYLMICERKSRGALIYDVRETGKLLGYLVGRDALGNQRVACDVFSGADGKGGFEVWSGSSGGVAKVWEGVGSVEGPHAPAWEWPAHGSTIGSTCLHPSGTVVATCAGSWEFTDEDDFVHHGSAGSRNQGHEGIDEEDGEHGEFSVSDAEMDSPPGQLSWMQRRNKESSLKIWSITDFPSEP